MFVWDDGTVTGSVDIDRLIAEYPDHPEAKRLLALREEASAKAEGPEVETQEEAPKKSASALAKKTAARKRAAKPKKES